jgi:hypothetical protein
MGYVIVNVQKGVVKCGIGDDFDTAEGLQLMEGEAFSYQETIYNCNPSKKIGPGLLVDKDGVKGEITRCAAPTNAFLIKLCSGDPVALKKWVKKARRMLGYRAY